MNNLFFFFYTNFTQLPGLPTVGNFLDAPSCVFILKPPGSMFEISEFCVPYLIWRIWLYIATQTHTFLIGIRFWFGKKETVRNRLSWIKVIIINFIQIKYYFIVSFVINFYYVYRLLFQLGIYNKLYTLYFPIEYTDFCNISVSHTRFYCIIL